METNCVFCKIVAGDVPATFAYRDDDVVAIEDLNPQAPHHLLVLPRKHYADVGEMIAGDPGLAQALLAAGAELGRQHGGNDGFRLVANTGRDGGQTVGHVHLHVLAGRPMGWPPG